MEAGPLIAWPFGASTILERLGAGAEVEAQAVGVAVFHLVGGGPGVVGRGPGVAQERDDDCQDQEKRCNSHGMKFAPV